MKRPGTEFELIDNTGTVEQIVEREIRPLMLAVSSFDKGPEDLRIVSGQTFYSLYGTDISYKKHGQPAIQAAHIIDNGGSLLMKRVVAEDATLSNLVVLAKVSGTQVQKVDSVTGLPVYIDKDTQQETDKATAADGTANEKAMLNSACISYDTASFESCKTLTEMIASIDTLYKIPAEQTEVTTAGVSLDTIAVDGEIPEGDNKETLTTLRTQLVELYNANKDKISTDYSTESFAALATALETAASVYSVPSVAVVDDYNNAIQVVSDAVQGLVELTDVEKADANQSVFPIFVIADNGRGADSGKRFNITTDYAISKNLGWAAYKLNNVGTVDLDSEYTYFSIDEDIVYLGRSMALSESGKDLEQLRAVSTRYMDSFLKAVAQYSGMELDEVKDLDILLGCNLKGEKIQQITIDSEGYDLSSPYGLALLNGSNGSFGDTPFGTEAYENALLRFFNGEDTDAIYDVDSYRIEACIDANYPMSVKKAITELVNFRKDFFFFRDIGINANTYESINLIAADLPPSIYCADYVQYYDIVDKFTKKQVTVTICYSLAKLLIDHLNDHKNAPFNGILYNVIITDAIEGTVNYLPKYTPRVDQKTLLMDKQLNYASYLNDQLVMELQLTSQEKDTQLSYINNIILVQEIIRKIRLLCPRIRYSFIDKADGLDKYAADVQTVINTFSEQVNSIEFAWSADDIMLANHIFEATIKVAFKEYVQAERFSIFTVNNN